MQKSQPIMLRPSVVIFPEFKSGYEKSLRDSGLGWVLDKQKTEAHPVELQQEFYILKHPTFDDFYTSWRPYVVTRAKKYGYFLEEDIEDIVQDIFLAFWSNNYNKIYNPDISAWSTFFTSFITYRLMNRRTKESVDPLLNSRPIDSLVNQEGSYGVVIDLGRFKVEQENFSDKIEFDCFIEGVKAEIKECYPNRRGYVPLYFECKNCGNTCNNARIEKICMECGSRSWTPIRPPHEHVNKIERSHFRVFSFLLEGYTRKQISQILKFSEATISLLVRDIAELKIMVDFWDQFYGIGEE